MIFGETLSKKGGRTFSAETKTFAACILCTVIGAIIRLAYLIRYPVQPRDAYFYELLMVEWQNNGQISEQISFFSLSLWILKIPYCLFQYDMIKGGVLVNVLLGLLLIILAAYVAGHFFSNIFVVILSGLMVATHPILVRFSCSCLRENTFLLFMLIAIIFLERYYNRPNLIYVLAITAFGALSFLCRLEGIDIFVFYFLLVIHMVYIKRVPVLRSFFHLAAFFSSFVLWTICFIYLLNLRVVTFDDILLKMN